MSTEDWEGYIRTLLYPVIFSHDLSKEADRLIHLNSNVYKQNPSPQEYVDAIKLALQSGSRISDLLSFSQPEEAIRSFLAEMLRRLEAIVSDENFDGHWPRV